MIDEYKPANLNGNGTSLDEDHTETQTRSAQDPGIFQFNKQMRIELGLERNSCPITPTHPRVVDVPNWMLECKQYDGF